jgi:predicted unusual protein kinase regulating ubiquinone biosynthesis (AarF/ABC1/UbiB family)
MMVDQLFDLRTIHADPNPGNLAFRPDGTIVLYDFGCVKQIPDHIIDAYGATIRCGLEEDYAGVERGLDALGVLNPDGPRVELEYYKGWRDIFAVPFLASDTFDYAKSTIHDDVIKKVPGALKRIESFQPPSDLVFIDRAIAGHYGNLRKIGARGRFLAMLWPYLYPGGEPLPA